MAAKPDDKELVEVAGTFHNDTFDEDGKPDPPRPWGEVWRGWLEAKGKPPLTKTTEQMIEEAKKAGVEVTISTKPPGAGEIVLLPGVRPPTASS